MKLHLPSGPLAGEVELPVSKSIANRYLIISALAGNKLSLSGDLPEDIRVLRTALNSHSPKINIGMAGTAMRFLTAFYAVQEGKTVVLKGADRMKQRPIADLVDALKNLGAEIEYVENEGFPPLKITGKKLKGGEVEIPASVSSQFVSALMMIGPTMEHGLQIHLTGKVLSRPYIELTADCMRNCGAEVKLEENSVFIQPSAYKITGLNIEADWTSASYFYALAAARLNSKLLLKGLKIGSSQGDSILVDWFREMGVTSVQKDNGVEISSTGKVDFPLYIDFTDHPDLAQTFAFLAATLGKSLVLTGLDNLRLKETDRVKAIKSELKKLGVSVSVRGESITISGSISVSKAEIKTYNDHRMAMSAALLSTLIPVEIETPDVVAKSFPGFWTQVERFSNF